MIYTGNSPKNESLDYGVRYQIFQGKNGKIVTKERFFKDQKSLENFIDKESEKDDFYQVLSTITPQNESVDPFKGLKRAKDDADMKSGKYVTDGRGSVYEIPTSGKSQVVKTDGYDFRYNYSTKEIEMYKGSNKITAMGLSAGNWFDGPEYWCKKIIEELDESTTPTKTKKKAIYSFGRGEGSPVYDTLVQKNGESDREFSRRADKKYYDDMHKKESPGDSRNVYMKIVNESTNLVTESSGHPKLGKKIKQLKGWKIYQGTDQFGETVFRCFTPDDDYPAVGYEDWETDTLDAAISWIKNY